MIIPHWLKTPPWKKNTASQENKPGQSPMPLLDVTLKPEKKAMPEIIVDAATLANLVQIAAQLVTEVEAIRAANPDAWATVSADYAATVSAWDAAAASLAQGATLPPPAAQAVPSAVVAAAPASQVASAAGHFNDARASGQVAEMAVSNPSGIVTVSLGEGVQQAPPA